MNNLYKSLAGRIRPLADQCTTLLLTTYKDYVAIICENTYQNVSYALKMSFYIGIILGMSRELYYALFIHERSLQQSCKMYRYN